MFKQAEHLAHETARLLTQLGYLFSLEGDKVLIVATLSILEKAVVESTPPGIEPARSDEVERASSPVTRPLRTARSHRGSAEPDTALDPTLPRTRPWYL